MNTSRRFNSIARRIQRSWQWKKLRQIILLNLLAALAAAAAYLYARETAVTGVFAGWSLPRHLTMDMQLRGIAALRSLRYSFLWQGETYEVALDGFVTLLSRFGGPLLAAEGGLWLLGFFGSPKGARRLLKPLDKMAETAQRLSEETSARRNAERAQAQRLDAAEKTAQGAVDEARFHNLEHAIEKIDIGDRLSTGDKDLAGLEDAINGLLARMHDAYRQQAQFVSDASHELRTPIAVIQGYVRMLDRWGKDDQAVLEEAIAAIRTETEHMKTLVEQLLFLARGDSGKQQLNPEPVDLAGMMTEVLEEYRMIDGEHEWKSGHMEPAQVSADPALIKQAARVLVDNAARYTPEGGSIRLSAGAGADAAWFEVQDGGIGIAEEDVPRIFDRFFRADPARARQSGGTGLGLSIARWIVERHGGWFEVISRPEFGTRIRVCLPRNP
ncbi:MAG: sensor histidine kinase [Clostridia bacterium]|nr:sensor histidine kinase [Clostridia bacterium]